MRQRQPQLFNGSSPWLRAAAEAHAAGGGTVPGWICLSEAVPNPPLSASPEKSSSALPAMNPHGLAAALVLGLAIRHASACSLFLMDCKHLAGGAVSGRTMDFMRKAEVKRTGALGTELEGGGGALGQHESQQRRLKRWQGGSGLPCQYPPPCRRGHSASRHSAVAVTSPL